MNVIFVCSSVPAALAMDHKQFLQLTKFATFIFYKIAFKIIGVTLNVILLLLQVTPTVTKFPNFLKS